MNWLITSIFLTLTMTKTELVPVTIQVTNIRNNEGTIRIGVFKDNESFQSEQPIQYIFIEKTDLENGYVSTTIELQVGKYGLSLIDDENDNHALDYNWIGIPKEGFGFSNFDEMIFSKPHFRKFEIEILPDQENQVEMKVRYL